MEKYGSDNNAWELFKIFYKDPDGYPINENGYKMRNGSTDAKTDFIKKYTSLAKEKYKGRY